MPSILAIAWHREIPRKVPFVVVGSLAGLGIVVLASIPFLFVLGWFNHALGLDVREQWESRAWFNGVLSLVFNLATAYIAMVFLNDALGSERRKRKTDAA